MLSRWENTLFSPIFPPFVCYLKYNTTGNLYTNGAPLTYLLDRVLGFSPFFFLAICSQAPNLEFHGLFPSPHASKLQLRKKPFPLLSCLHREGWCCILFDEDDDSDSFRKPDVQKLWPARALPVSHQALSLEGVHIPCGLFPALSPNVFRGSRSMKGDSKRTGFSLAHGMCFFLPTIYPWQFVSSALLPTLSIAP